MAPITHRQRIDRSNVGEGLAMMDYTVRASLRAVANVAIERPNGDVEVLEQPTRRDGMVTGEWMEKAALTADELGTLFLVASAISEVSAPLLSKCGQA